MKKLPLLILALGIFISVSQPLLSEKETKPQLTWMVNYNKALALAKEINRPILINFTGSDWCPWCKRLQREVLTQPPFIDYASENLILLFIDFPKRRQLPETQREHNQKLYNGYRIRGFPTLVIVDAEGKVLAHASYQRGGARKYVAYLKNLLKAQKQKSKSS